ncbi:S8 family serine peptidase [Bdellovibrio sp. HCB337]|uniref:S8 family serine peptidase n=1 Tax=Bdellovibrio sp. HCB337 TaxID=3394358 RepID=UPI0039A76B85
MSFFAFFVGLSLANAQTNSSATQEAVPGEYIVKLKDMAAPSGVLNKMQGKLNLKGSFQRINMYHVSLKGGAQDVQSLEDLAADPDVEYIEPNYIFKKSVDDQEGLGAPAQVYEMGEVQAMEQYSAAAASYSQSGAQTKVAEAWAIQTSNSSIRPIVAIIDTGLDKTHPVFVNSNAVWVNSREIANNGVDDDYNGYIDDVNGWNFINNTPNFADDDGHGTHVAGIVVGTSLNILANPITETAKMQVMPLKFLDANGSGTTSNAIRAIYYAVNNGARVINNSWGGGTYSRSLHEAMTFAYSNRIFIASAAGNNGKSNDTTPMYPSSYDVPSNLSVAATTDYDYMASFSNFGSRSVHLASPGVLILSTLPNNRTGTMSGTSMATPFVAGLAALAMREAPFLTGYQIRDIMIAKATSISNLLGKVSSSARVDALRLINEAQVQSAVQASQPSYSPSYAGEARSLASAEVSPKTGCGLVSTALLKGPGSSSGGFNGGGVMAGLFLLPVIVWAVLRQRALEKAKPASDPRRKYERFKMDSDIRVMVGDRELAGSLKTISLGGASFCADEALEKGGIITMKISSPDGKDLVEVQGQVVWSEANQAYGVQFAGAEQSTLSMIQKWTAGLTKA